MILAFPVHRSLRHPDRHDRTVGPQHRHRHHDRLGARHRPHHARADARAEGAGIRRRGAAARREHALHHARRAAAELPRACSSSMSACASATRSSPSASSGFLGLGLPPPNPDWGGMVKESTTVSQRLAAHGARPVHRHRQPGAGLQPARRRRCGRPGSHELAIALLTGHLVPSPCSRSSDLRIEFRGKSRPSSAVPRAVLQRPPGRKLRPRRRIRLRQEHHGDGHHGLSRQHGTRRGRPHRVQGAGSRRRHANGSCAPCAGARSRWSTRTR